MARKAAPSKIPGPGEPKPGPQFLTLALILRPHGVRGDLSIKVLTDFPERMNDLGPVYVGTDPEKPEKFTAHQVVWAHRAKKDNWLLRFEGIETREDADLLRNRLIFVSLADVVPVEADEIYLFQILGLEVHTFEGLVIGRLSDIISTVAIVCYVL